MSGLLSVADVIGYIVSPLSILVFALQFWKSYKSGDASGISYISQFVVMLGVTIWIIYGAFYSTTDSDGNIKDGNLATGLVNSIISPMVLYTLWASLRDNGISKKVTWSIVTTFAISLLIVIFLFIVRISTNIIETTQSIKTFALVAIFIAGTSTATAFIPQTIKTIKSKDPSSLSLAMVVTYLFANTSWVIFFSLLLANDIQIQNHMGTITQGWGVFTSVVPTIVQAILLFTVLKYGDYSFFKNNNKKIANNNQQ